MPADGNSGQAGGASFGDLFLSRALTDSFSELRSIFRSLIMIQDHDSPPQQGIDFDIGFKNFLLECLTEFR